MVHVVLARKYRPRSFDQMVGQSHVVQALTHALESGRLHHAYLFTGTRGIGKTTVSRILAKSLNCTGADGTGGVTAHPCGQCMACIDIDADRYIDYIELDAASNRSIDEIRELIERAAYKPSVGRYKVFMIDEAHQLTKDAFNALLKTLEEPPEYLKFVLATTDPDKMLPTVLSRCLQFNLRPMSPDTVAQHLDQVLQAEGVACDAGALRLLARAARGSMRDALSLTDQAIAFGGGRLQEEAVRVMLGTVDRSHAARLVHAMARRDGLALLSTLGELRAMGLSAAGTLEEMAALLQQMAVEQAVPGALDDGDPDTSGARALAGELQADETQLLYSILLHGRAELGLLNDEHAALTMVMLRFLAFPPFGAPAATGTVTQRTAPLSAAPITARISTPVRLPTSGPVPLPSAPAALPQPAPLLDPAHSRPPKLGRTTAASAEASQRSVPLPAPAVSAPSAAAAPALPSVRPPSSAAAPTPAVSGADGREDPPPWVDDVLPDDEPSMQPASPAEPLKVAPSAAAPSSTAPATTGAPALTPTALGQRWVDLLRPLLGSGAVLALVRELALQAQLIEEAPGTAAAPLRFCLRVERDTLRNPALASKLAAAMGAALDQPVVVETVAGVATDSLALREAVARYAAQRAAEQAIRGDATVQDLLARFHTARIVAGSIRPIGSDGRLGAASD